MTIYRSHNPGARTDLPRKEAAALQRLPLICRDCSQHCRKSEALKVYRRVLRCPRCGGLLERRRPQVGS